MSKRTVLTILTIFVAVVLVGCSKEEAPAPAPSQPAATTAGPPVDTANAATITGKVNYKDGKPRRIPLRMDAEPSCKAVHKEPQLSEDKVINDNGTVRWATVYVKEGLGGRTFPTPPQPVTLDQKGCVYQPHVVAVMTNQPLNIANSDPVTHNIHPGPKVNREWNESQPPGAGNLNKAFAREELAIATKCNIHPWMRSYIHVFSHPYFSVTKEDGSFELKGLPPGEYTIAVWSEALGTQEQKITVAAKEAKTVDFTLTGK